MLLTNGFKYGIVYIEREVNKMFKVILANGKALPNEFINAEWAERFIALNKLNAHIERW